MVTLQGESQAKYKKLSSYLMQMATFLFIDIR